MKHASRRPASPPMIHLYLTHIMAPPWLVCVSSSLACPGVRRQQIKTANGPWPAAPPPRGPACCFTCPRLIHLPSSIEPPIPASSLLEPHPRRADNCLSCPPASSAPSPHHQALLAPDLDPGTADDRINNGEREVEVGNKQWWWRRSRRCRGPGDKRGGGRGSGSRGKWELGLCGEIGRAHV